MIKTIEFKRLKYVTPSQIKEIKDLLNTYVTFGLLSDGAVWNLIKNHKVYVTIVEGVIVSVLTLYISVQDLKIKHTATAVNHRKKGYGSTLFAMAVEDSRGLTITVAGQDDSTKHQ